METDPSNCLNNSDYKMTYGDKTFFVKYSGSRVGPDDRLKNEFSCARIASSVGIAHRPLLHDEEHGVLISGFIQNARYLDFQESGSKERYINLLKKLHCIQQPFPKEFSPFKAIRECFAKAVEMEVVLPESLEKEVLPQIEAIEQEGLLRQKVPCHLDAHLENVIDNGKDLYLVDWEFAAMCDPWFDLACVSALENFSNPEMSELLQLYLGQLPSDEELQRLYRMRIVADVRFSTHCFLQIFGAQKRREIYRAVAERYLNHASQRVNR